MKGTHVLIEDKDNFESIYLASMPAADACEFPKSKFHLSQESVAFQPAGWLLNKKLPAEVKEVVNQKLIWNQCYKTFLL